MKTINAAKVTAFLLVILLTGITLQSCNKTKPLTETEMEGYWVLKTMNGEDGKSQFKGALPTLQFNFADNTISGTGGCNQYNGVYTYKDGIFSAPNLAVTQMLCTEDNNEGQFVLELTNANNVLTIVDGLLTISHDGKVVLEFEKGQMPIETASVTPLAVEPANLAGEWKLANIDGVDATTKFGGEEVPTLSFNFVDNKINGYSGCNKYNATFRLDKDQLVVGLIMSTRMSCPNLEGEAQFTQAIADTSVLTMPSSEVLQVAKNGTVLLEFAKVVSDATSVVK